ALGGGSESVRNVLQRRAQAERAVFHGPGDELLHAFELGGSCRTIVLADDVVAHASGANEGADIDRRMRTLVEPLEIIAKRSPVLRHAEVTGLRCGIPNHPIVYGCDG